MLCFSLLHNCICLTHIQYLMSIRIVESCKEHCVRSCVQTCPNVSLVVYIINDDVYCIANNLQFPCSLFLRQGHYEGDQLADLPNVISRFRANLVVAGVEAFEEDNWSHLIIGSTQFMVS